MRSQPDLRHRRQARRCPSFVLALAALGLATTTDAAPDFSSLPCPQRWQQVIGYWGGLPPSANACEAAKRKLASARDLVATKDSCGETRDWRTSESAVTLRSHEQDVNLLCGSGTGGGSGGTLRKANAGDAGTKAGCPTTIRIGGQAVSVLEPIQANGSAEVALSQAREQLRTITDQGSCDSFANAQECRVQLQSWREMVSALECHARAERSAPTPAQPATAPAPAGKAASADASAQAAGKPAAKAEDFLAFADRSGSAKPRAGASPPAASTGGAKSFLSFADKGASGDEDGIFPTPNCQFISDSSEQHNAAQRVCVDEMVWECENRASADPKKAWRRYGLTRSGCGGVRRIEAVERDRQQLKRATKGWTIHD